MSQPQTNAACVFACVLGTGASQLWCICASDAIVHLHESDFRVGHQDRASGLDGACARNWKTLPLAHTTRTVYKYNRAPTCFERGRNLERGMADKSGPAEYLLGLTAEFDVKSGYLLVEGEGVLGKQHRGAYDTYTNTLTHHIGRDDVGVFTRNFVRSSRPSNNVAQDMVFAPRKGDRILCVNYRELVPPMNWLDVDPPGAKSAWNTEGRRLLWKDYIEQQWQECVENVKSINPSYVELGRGTMPEKGSL